MRNAIESRESKETKVNVSVNLDGTGKSKINTGIGFFDHMLIALSKYSKIDMEIEAKGDLECGTHHTIEDVGIVLGSTILKALGDKKGISRAGYFKYMMDDALVGAEAVLDVSGRGRLIFEDKDGKELKYSNEIVGIETERFPSEEVKEFFWSLASNLKANIGIILCKKGNAHHEIEATFKAFGKALRMAVEYDPRSVGEIPSTKGIID